MSIHKEWFENWFDTSYYHLLYDHRNDQEAAVFMSNMLGYLKLNPGDKVLDLPCGRGRHAVYLHSKGLEVVGADISKNSILKAKEKYSRDGLTFEIHDMRTPLQSKYHAIFNLFTSFGYFSSMKDNLTVLKNFKYGLMPNGKIIIDFLNLNQVAKNLTPLQIIEKDAVRFEIRKHISDGFVNKDILIHHQGKSQQYRERVQALDLNTFEHMVQKTDLQLEQVFGSYQLDPFEKENSERLILVLS